jgi:hypothetical protein
MKPIPMFRLSPWAERVAREPLIHFLVLGALIFGADAALTRVRGSDGDIRVPDEVRKEVRSTFAAAARRDPTEAELKPLFARWIDNEILYREGLALGLDKGDPAMRERVIFKALNVVQAGIVLPRIDDAGLRAWFAANHARYDVAGRVSFDEAVPSADATPDSLRRFVAALNGQQAPELESSLRVFKQRPRDTIVQAYGEAFASALDRLQPGSWATVASSGGLRAVRLTESVAGTTVRYEDVRDRVYQDWKDDTSARLTTQAVRTLGQRYRIRGGDGS